MSNKTVWLNFIQSLRDEQKELRQYLFEAGTMHVGREGGDTMETVRREIARLQETIDRVIAEQGLENA
jgi:ribosomal protein L29